MGTGGLTLILAARYKMRWSWWLVGALVMALARLVFPLEPKGRKQMILFFNKIFKKNVQKYGSAEMDRPGRAYFPAS
jgi:hypothetical protein